MSRLYLHEAEVTLARPLSAAQLSSPNIPPNATIVRDLRMMFTAEKNLGSEPNTCALVIVNLGEEGRALVQRKPLYVRVDAGFDGKLERLFVGDMRFGQSVPTATGWETRIEIGDGERSFREGRVSRSYQAGIPALAAVNEAASAMGFVPKMSAATSALLRRQYSAGLSLTGAAHRELSRILASFDLTWSVQDGVLEIMSTAEVRPDLAVLISEQTGMVGSPEFGAPESKKKAPHLLVRTLLKPAVRPGGRIQVESRAVRGLFKVLRVRHVGDSGGQDWHTEIEARQ